MEWVLGWMEGASDEKLVHHIDYILFHGFKRVVGKWNVLGAFDSL